MCYRLVRRLVLALGVSCRPEFPGSQPVVLGPRYRRCAGCTSTYSAHSLPSRRGEGGRGSRVRPPGLLYFRQLLFCRLVDGADGAPACNSARPPPVETTRPHVMIQRSHYSTRGLRAWGRWRLNCQPSPSPLGCGLHRNDGARDGAFHHCHSERSEESKTFCEERCDSADGCLGFFTEFILSPAEGLRSVQNDSWLTSFG